MKTTRRGFLGLLGVGAGVAATGGQCGNAAKPAQLPRLKRKSRHVPTPCVIQSDPLGLEPAALCIFYETEMRNDCSDRLECAYLCPFNGKKETKSFLRRMRAMKGRKRNGWRIFAVTVRVDPWEHGKAHISAKWEG